MDAILLHRLPALIEQDRERQIAALPVLLLDRCQFLVQLGEVLHGCVVERENLETVALLLLVEVSQARQTAGDTRASPMAPELDEKPLATKVGDGAFLRRDAAHGSDPPGWQLFALVNCKEGCGEVDLTEVDIGNLWGKRDLAILTLHVLTVGVPTVRCSRKQNVECGLLR